MLRSLNDLEHYAVRATDGPIGDVSTFFFDDQRWAVRYLVVKTSGFWDGSRVLISPISIQNADWSTRSFHLALTQDKIRKSPSVDVDMPVSRRHEQEFAQYYRYPYYWGGMGYWGMGMYPGLLASPGLPAPKVDPSQAAPGDDFADVHLRSARAVRGYHVHGSDDAIGHIDDFIVDDESWVIRYLVVDTRNWWFGKKVLVAPDWARKISWESQEVTFDITRQSIKDSPVWDPHAPIARDYESRLCDYYGRPVYSSGGVPAPGRAHAVLDSHRHHP